jgi:hypothetical protein
MTSKLTVQHYARLIADFKPLGQNQLDCKLDDMVFVEEEGKKFYFKKLPRREWLGTGNKSWNQQQRIFTNILLFLCEIRP